MKKILVLMLALVLVFAAVPMETLNIHANAATTKTVDQAMTWLDGLVGKKVGSGQCVALIKEYYEYLGAPTPYGNGCDYATNSLPSGWKRIKGGTPKVGDILVWTQGYKDYGHVAICGGTSKYYHQNWDGLYVQILKKSYTSGFSISSGAYYANYWGVIRPDFKTASTPSVSYEDIVADKYFIKNKASGEYLTVENGKDADLTRIHTSAFANKNSQVYNIYLEDDGYEMMPLCSTTRVVNPYAWTVESGKEVNLYTKSDDGSQWWKFQLVDDGYVIRNSQNPDVCIANASSDDITVETYTGAENQIWYLEKACTMTYDANGGTGAPASHRVRAGYEISLPAEKPTKTCCKFMGWSVSPDDTAAGWDEINTFTAYEDMTVYAVWSDDHAYEIAVTYPTCIQNGVKTYTCSECGDTYTESIEPTGHHFRYGVCIDCGAMDPDAFILSGAVISFGSSEDPVTVDIYTNNSDTALRTLTIKNGSFMVMGLPAGEYKLVFSKQNHVSREYMVTLSDHETFVDAKIHLIGDVDGNGKINVGDVAKINGHIKENNILTDEYQLLCANINGGKLNMGDPAALYAHIKGTKLLY